ncbi:MAG: lipopolysaccharide biosynthesis protein, partial [Acidimicrobiales bacterium]
MTAAIQDRLASVPVVKSGLSLMTGTMVTSGLGLIFWILAANLYDPADFGVSTTAVYTMMMLADVACLGLRTGLVRFLPRSGNRTGRTILWGYGLVASASTITAAVFLLGLQLWAPDLVELRNSGLLFIFFVAATAFWALFMLEDAVLVGLRKATWVPIENSLFGVLKILLLFPLAKLSPTLGIFWAWTLPVFPIVIGINVFLARFARTQEPVGEDRSKPPARSLLRDIMSFSLADWFAAVARLAALGVIPLMVLAQLDTTEAGYFQASWLIAFTIFALSSNAAYALLAETSYEQAKLHENSIHAGVLSLVLTAPIIAIGVIGAPLLLRIYGTDYAENSATVLRILLIAAVPNIVHQIFIGRLRSQGRMGAVVFFETLLSALVVTLAWFLLPRYGIDGVGYAWLVGLMAMAAYAAASESLWWWAARIDTRFVRRAGSAFRWLSLGRPARGMDTRLDDALATIDDAGSEVSWLHGDDGGRTAIIDLTDDRQLVIDFARSTQGAGELCRRRKASEQLGGENRLAEIHPLLPET